ncbi:DNA topoisomerase III [Ligilactobacillus salitolerans]|uniref:DNA topoisomerase n=1 Tax=Ligilactobacillus salitolerans TaxID=1808352 RepID=A0A401IQE4_9LACO|nr:type IA DNA topoisomerase [Ligilactobacillus salitolerans]GBG93758.1 DNA topoisomerase III [Ligilactobacillus salitolerans]
MTTVILAEKPSQARAYVEALHHSTKKAGYYEVSDSILPAATTITFGFGHLVELATPDKYDRKYQRWSLKNLPIFPAHYKFVVPADKRKQFNVVRELLKQADTIIIATDSDREGENIAWSIMKQAKIDLKSKTLKRLWINSLEPEAIRDGLMNLRPGWDYYPAYQEAQTRQISDWLIGMNGSPLYSLLLRKVGAAGVYSIGRVQTPTLYMVYQRDLSIKNFQSEPYLELQAKVAAQTAHFTAQLEPNRRFKNENELQDWTRSKNVVAGPQPGVIRSVQKQNKKIASPRLFSLSSLQSEVNRRFHVSASQTLKAVQALYEDKLLTYPRTDCNYITEKEFAYLVQNLSKYQTIAASQAVLNRTQAQARYVNGARVQEHHAIIMTKKVPTKAKLEALPSLQKKIYDLVLRTTLAMFAQPYEYQETTIITRVGQADFKAVGKIPLKPGWKLLFAKDEQNSKNQTQTLPEVEQGQKVSADVKSVQKMTQPPKAFTEGTLITAMKTAGKTLDDEQAQAILKDTEGIGTEATRANILEVLKKRKYLITQKNQLHVTAQGMTLCQAVESEPLLTSPEMTAKWETALKQIGQNQRTQANFLHQIQQFIGKMLEEVPQQLQANAELKQAVISRKEMVQPAAGNSKVVMGTCPVCHEGQIVDKGKFYGCSNYRAAAPCKFTLPKKWSSKTIPQTAVKALLITGKTRLLKGFTSKKTGKKFAAKLVLKDQKLQFDFT